ncbi:hypothetical protein SAMN05444008_11636 [Cnuella takakiae]|uniref:Carboxypeptidase regulatory-like domain-containing protein n=1 Tax=Cnuella takakiae TaxID=1302690 RepID=A0A1M5GE16_9BACT|nr:carboxypeptidase-like regulatory domain-containing protein [Cnuella takakiae]OLY92384.1 hypothetical protein BUE76_11145 [Cnuella takakiae]SHG01929.1 hypothetical protein SAMN05444008_11636 [Cnuella takakiae]
MKMILKSTTALALASIALFSFKPHTASSLKGKIAPAESVGTVWAIAGTDSLKTSAIEGEFSFAEIKPGTYKIVAEAKAPYKNLEKEGVEVKEGETTDLGTLMLQQ